MDEPSARLRDWIIDFIGALGDCYTETTFAQDRPIFASDIAVAATWLVDLQRGMEPELVIEKILSSETSKKFGDYWRNGEWGDRSASALEDLRAAVRSH